MNAMNVLQRAIPIKTYLQNAIVDYLTYEEMLDIKISVLNKDVIDKLIEISRPYYENEPTTEMLDVLALSIGTIIKEYEWGVHYLGKEGVREIQDKIRCRGPVSKSNRSICDDLMDGNNNPINDVVLFDSTDHVRYMNGKDISGHNYGCNRQVKIQNNIDGGVGYTVTIYNLDGIHPLWGNNVQMAPKQMKIIDSQGGVVSLRGFGCDTMGNSFSDYGIDVYLSNNEIEKIVLKMFDRNVEIEYLK